MKELSSPIPISPAIAPYLKKDAPREARLKAAGGLIPLPSSDLIPLFYHLLSDKDAQVRENAKKSLDGLPLNMLETFLANPELHPKILDYFAREVSLEHKHFETIALNRGTNDATIIFLAGKDNRQLLEIISHNQERIIRTPQIAEVLINNPNLDGVNQDRVLSFYQNYILSQPIADLPKDKEEAERDLPEKMEEKDELPQEAVKVVLPTEAKDEDGELTEEQRESLFQKIQRMPVSEKIKLALRGNKEARDLLVRDPNKIVATSVIRSPKITDGEVLKICQSRNVSEEVLRIISNNKEWTRNYQIKLELTNNPKTPLPMAIKFIGALRDSDLRMLTRSKNIPQALASTARRVLSQKKM
ncbi:MAG: hypothetical protein JSU92_15185 [Deltaproteobacteria bacterium]|nr:MAG: hypothetical protein JSU92_15185 [Deltaproteobacteria bacterium]